MRELNQRYWDAMIIRAWNKFDNVETLCLACKYEFGMYPNQTNLLRTKNLFRMGTRVWVATFLKPLSEKLWATPKDQQIKLLDWLENSRLDCIRSKKAAMYGQEAYNKLVQDRKHLKQASISRNLEETLLRNNMWNIVK
jgi:hypothetical protein